VGEERAEGGVCGGVGGWCGEVLETGDQLDHQRVHNLSFVGQYEQEIRVCVCGCVYAIEGSLGAVGERTVRHWPCIPGWRSAWSSSVAAMWGHLSAAAMMVEWDERVS
jgi:hypothetical protein